MLSGDNGILQRATDAKTNTDNAQIREKIRLAYNSALTKDITNQNGEVQKSTLEDELENEFPNKAIEITDSADKKEWVITIDGVTENVPIGKDAPKVVTLPSGNGTKPYFPSSAFSKLDGTDLTTGLVITDAENPGDTANLGNEYVWIEVPSTYVDNTVTTGPDYSSVSNSTDYANISTALRNYCKKDANGADLIKIGTSSESSITTTYGITDEWYEGCGISSSTEYDNLYHIMLTSIYTNGGFWIGRYEAGMTGNSGRSNANVSIDGVIPLSQPNLIPIFYVTCSQAQTIATSVPNKGTYNSSLMFGIQWDLVLRHLSNKGISTDVLTGSSESWGNFTNTTNATLTGGKYTQYMSSSYQNTFNTWSAYDVDLGEIVKNKVFNNTNMPQSVLLTTGSSNKFVKKNIYDLAGNIQEFSLEKGTSDSYLPVVRGGGFQFSTAVSYRSGTLASQQSCEYSGFRVAIY